MQFFGHEQQLSEGARARRALGGLLFLALLFSQLALATHQFDHTSTDIGDTCAECLVLDRTGDAPVSTELATLPASATCVLPAAGFFNATATRTYAYRQRAPPLD